MRTTSCVDNSHHTVCIWSRQCLLQNKSFHFLSFHFNFLLKFAWREGSCARFIQPCTDFCETEWCCCCCRWRCWCWGWARRASLWVVRCRRFDESVRTGCAACSTPSAHMSRTSSITQEPLSQGGVCSGASLSSHRIHGALSRRSAGHDWFPVCGTAPDI